MARMSAEEWQKMAQAIQARQAKKTAEREAAQKREQEAKNADYRARVAQKTGGGGSGKNVPSTDYHGYTPSGAAESRARAEVEKEDKANEENRRTAWEIVRKRGYTKNPSEAGPSTYRGINLQELAQEEYDDFQQAQEYVNNLEQNRAPSATEQIALNQAAKDAEEMDNYRVQARIAAEGASHIPLPTPEATESVSSEDIDSALKASDKHYAKRQANFQKGRDQAKKDVEEIKAKVRANRPDSLIAGDRKNRAVNALVKEASSYGYKGDKLAEQAGAAYDKALAKHNGSSEKARKEVSEILFQNASKKNVAAARASMDAKQKAREDAIRNNPMAAKRREALSREWGANQQNPSFAQADARARWAAKANADRYGNRRNIGSDMDAYVGSAKHGFDTLDNLNKGWGGNAPRSLIPTGSAADNFAKAYEFNQNYMKTQQDMMQAQLAQQQKLANQSVTVLNNTPPNSPKETNLNNAQVAAKAGAEVPQPEPIKG